MAVVCNIHRIRRLRSTVMKMKLHRFPSRLINTRRKNLSKIKPNLNYITICFDKWCSIHFTILFICTLSYFCLSSMNSYDNTVDMSYSKNNKSLTKSQNYSWIYSEWCSSYIIISNNINSYIIMNKFIIFLYGICFILFVMGLLLYMILMKQFLKEITNKRLFFRLGMIILSMFVGSSICNQLISSLICRPIEMLYNIRYTLMIIIQIIGFIASLHFAYGFGQIYGPVLDQLSILKILELFIPSK